MMETVGAAEEIADYLLHRTGRGLMTGEFDVFAACFELPQVLETTEGTRLVKDRDDLRRIFDSMRQFFREREVTDLVRSVVSSRFQGPNKVESIHVSRLLKAGGETYRAPYPVYSVLQRRPDGWKITFSHYVILDSRTHNGALVGWSLQDSD